MKLELELKQTWKSKPDRPHNSFKADYAVVLDGELIYEFRVSSIEEKDLEIEASTKIIELFEKLFKFAENLK